MHVSALTVYSMISTDYIVNARYTVMGITHSIVHAARPLKRHARLLARRFAVPSAVRLWLEGRAQGRCALVLWRYGDTGPAIPPKCEVGACSYQDRQNRTSHCKGPPTRSKGDMFGAAYRRQARKQGVLCVCAQMRRIEAMTVRQCDCAEMHSRWYDTKAIPT